MAFVKTFNPNVKHYTGKHYLTVLMVKIRWFVMFVMVFVVEIIWISVMVLVLSPVSPYGFVMLFAINAIRLL